MENILYLEINYKMDKQQLIRHLQTYIINLFINLINILV